MAVPYTFATATSAIPLSQLDANFATAITLGNTAVYLGNTTTSLGNLTLTNVNISSVAATFPNSYLANSSVTLGNTTVSLGGTASSIGNLTLTNVTINSGTINAAITQSYSNANAVVYSNSSNVGTTSSTFVFDGTNLGIGTASPGSKLNIAGTSAGNGCNFRLQNTTATTGKTWQLASADAGQLYFSIPSVLDAIVIDSSGNVGIGTSSPDTKFQVSGTSGSAQFKAGTDANGYLEINAYDSNPVYCVVAGANATAGVFGTQTNIPTVFFTNNTERMRIDSSGNVGIGGTPAYKLDVTSSAFIGSRLTASTGTNGVSQVYSNTGGNVSIGIDASTGANFGAAYGAFLWHAGAYPILFGTSNAERMRIDSSGNVGIGTSSPSYKLSTWTTGTGTTAGSNTIGQFYSNGSGYDANIRFGDNNNSAAMLGYLSGNMYMYTNGAERMRIDSSGTVFMGQTTNPATGTLVLKVPTGTGNGCNAQITSNTGTSYPWSNYNATGTYVGGISCTSSATAFPTSSDVRLKKNIENAPSAIDNILSARVVSHDWIDDAAHVEYGFIAQELNDVIPQAVIEGKDKEDGTIEIPWGVDYSKLVPLLTKAIQEQQELIKQLQADVKKLQGAK